MGFGFNLAFIFIIMPVSIILFAVWMLTQKGVFGIILGLIWVTIISIAIFSAILTPFYHKKKLDKKDYYGEYIIDRDFFEGKQADWQYNHFRFEITEADSIFFHFTEKEKIIKTYKGTISTVKPYNSARLIVNMPEFTHHVLTSNPTTYRSVWSFYLVFHSPKFNNMFFRKGKWQEL